MKKWRNQQRGDGMAALSKINNGSLAAWLSGVWQSSMKAKMAAKAGENSVIAKLRK